MFFQIAHDVGAADAVCTPRAPHDRRSFRTPADAPPRDQVMENLPEMPNTAALVVDTILIWYVLAGDSVVGTFQVKVWFDVGTDVVIVFTSTPALSSWIFTFAPGLPVVDQVIACELPRAQEAPVVGEVTVMLLLTEAAGPVSTRVWDAPALVYAPTAVQLAELVQTTPLRVLLLLLGLGLATTAQVLPFQVSTRV
jgi:hypothetical protein